jgi:endonuclease YncB( thermonuclease family)
LLVKWRFFVNRASGTISGMPPLFMSLLLNVMVCMVVTPVLHAQNAANATPEVDFSHDPCGNPMIENDLWYSIDGRVTSVENGRTIMVALADDGRPLRVRLVGIALESRGSFPSRAKTHVEAMALGKSVGILVNPSQRLGQEKKTNEVTGVVQLTEGVSRDVGLSLLADGLARSAQPRPYTVSRYTLCQYRRAESEAQSKKLGVWR